MRSQLLVLEVFARCPLVFAARATYLVTTSNLATGNRSEVNLGANSSHRKTITVKHTFRTSM
jgi:hypothetical protein